MCNVYCNHIDRLCGVSYVVVVHVHSLLVAAFQHSACSTEASGKVMLRLHRPVVWHAHDLACVLVCHTHICPGIGLLAVTWADCMKSSSVEQSEYAGAEHMWF